MSRWIDADALEYDTEWSEYHDGFTAYSQMAIDTAPSIDIVRCRECKYAVNEGAQRALVCDNSYIDMDIHPDDFCSYGERNCSEKPNNCEDEPQYEMGMGTLKCDNCSEYGSFKCTKCDGEMYFKRLEPKDEPQIDCAWK